MARGNEADTMASDHVGSVVHSLQRLFGPGTVNALSEAQLLERFLVRRDEAAFEAILKRHGPMVHGVCRRLLDDPHDVDDAFQVTFLILVKKARSIRDRDILGTWLYGVARRVAVRAKVNARRRRFVECGVSPGRSNGGRGAGLRTGLHPAFGHPLPGGEGLSPGSRLEAEELRSLIDDELERLPQKYRAPLVLCDLEGQTHEQAAVQLRCPVGTIKSRLARGRARLRSRLVRRGVAPAAVLATSALEAEAAPAVPAALMNQTLAAAGRLAAGPAITAGTTAASLVSLYEGVMRSMALAKLKSTAAAAILCVVAGLGIVAATSALVAQAPAQPDSKHRGSPAAAPERGVERLQLENGLKVILRPIRGAGDTALVVLYAIGNDHDPPGHSGLGNLVEQVYLTAAAGKAKARTAEEFIRRYPGGANGQMGDRYAAFATVFPAKELDDELQDAAARMGDLHVTADDLARERPRLLAQLGHIFGSFLPLAAQNNARELIRPTPRGGRHGGLPAEIRKLSLEDVQSYWRRYFKPRNALLVLAGAVEPAKARQAIREHFARLEPGEGTPEPGQPEPPKFGVVRETTVKSAIPNAQPTICLAYAAPQPGSAQYAPFLVLIARLWAAAEKLGGDPSSLPVCFTPMDDGAFVAVSAPAKPGENVSQAVARLETFVAETIAPPLRDTEITATQQELGFFLGTIDLPDEVLQNIYGVAFSLGRRAQLAIDSAGLKRALEAVNEQDLRRVANEVFAPARHAAVLVTLEK
jgi:zinc protease